MAYKNPMLKCIGVENCKSLHEGAEKVLKGLREKRIEPSNVNLVHCDAIVYLSNMDTARAGIIYCYDQGFQVGIRISRPSNHTLPPPFRRGCGATVACALPSGHRRSRERLL